MDLVQVLQHAQNPDATIRNQAETHLNQAVESQYGQFVLALCVEFAADGKADNNRQLAGLYLKNLITAQDEQILQQKRNKWLACDPSLKDQIRVGFLQSLLNTNQVVRHTGAQILAAFGATDVPRNDWPALIPALLTNVLTAEIPSGTKVASLEALGYLCEGIEPDSIDGTLINQILSAIINGLRTDCPNEIRLAAITALNNSLDFAANNFEVEIERNAIMKTVCETTQCSDVKVREKSFECFAKIADLYYDKLASYVTAIFQLTTTAIKTDEEIVGLQAVEFWITLCDCEMSIMEDIENGIKTVVILNIADQAAPSLMPFLLEAMTKQSEDIDGDETWNVSMAAAQCVEYLARCIRDKIVDITIPFVSANIQNTNWHMKEAAIMAFGSILDGPSQEKLTPIVSQAIQVLISCLQDKTMQVRETTAWTLGKICEFHKGAIGQDALNPMITALAVSLEDRHPKVASQACFAIHNLAEACEDEREANSNVISIFMTVMLQKLFVVATRSDWDEENLRVSAYEAVNMIVHNSALDMIPVVVQVLTEALTRLEQTMLPQFNPKERVDLQSMLCSLLGECIRKLEISKLAPFADRLMQSLLQVFTHRGAAAHEDAFMTIGYLADILQNDFNRYVQFLLPILINSLKNVEEYQVCTTAVGLVGDMSRALGNKMAPYCDDIIRCLIDLLQSSVLNRIVKPHVISCFADVALAIEGDFERYTNLILTMLKQAGDLSVETDDEEIIDYINTLHVAIFESYSGILQGLKASKKQDAVLVALDGIVDFMARSTASEYKSIEIVKAAVGLLGDLGQIFGKRVINVFKQPFVSTLIQEGLVDEDVRETALWAQTTITNIMQNKA